MATASLMVSFPCGLRGYHVYKDIWTHVLGEELCTIHESDDHHVRFAIVARKRLPGSQLIESTVGHLPKEISRITQYNMMMYGAIVSVKVMDAHQRRYPLVQGGLEISVQVKVVMEFSALNKKALSRYDKLIRQSYKELVDGKFDDINDFVLEAIENSSDEEEIDLATTSS